MYARPLPDSRPLPPRRKFSIPAEIALACTAVATLALGIVPGRLLNFVQRATPINVAIPLATDGDTTVPTTATASSTAK